MRSLAAKIHAANSTLIVNGDLDAVGEFFTTDYVAHLTDQDMDGGHAATRSFLGTLQRAFPDLEVEVEILVEGKDRLAWSESSGAPTRVNSRASRPQVVKSSGAT